MNTITIKTLNDEDMLLSIPSNTHEISFGQMIDLRKPDITDFEVISILSGVSISELYDVRYYQEAIESAKLCINVFTHNLQAAFLNQLPKKVSFVYDGKLMTKKIKGNLSIQPVAAHIAASKVIASEIDKHIELYGEDDIQTNFNPSFKGCAAVVNAFLYCRVTGKNWNDDHTFDITRNMSAFNVLAIAKHFYNKYPDLCSIKPVNRRIKLGKGFWTRLKDLYLLTIESHKAQQRNHPA